MAAEKGKDDEEEEPPKGCQLSPEMIKLVSLLTLLISDFDIVMTIVAMIAYYMAGGVFMFGFGLVLFFFLLYVAACVYAAKESDKFLVRFKDKIKCKEINGISVEDLEDALSGKRIFWMGPIYEIAKKRKGVIDALKAITPSSVDPQEIDVEMLEQALKDAQDVGADKLRMPDDPSFGAREIKRAEIKLKTAKAVQAGESTEDIKDDIDVVNPEGFSPEAKQLEAELQEAESANDDNRVKMMTLVLIDQLDSFKVPMKLVDKQGKITDETRALYLVCEARGILQSYHKAARSFARRIVKPTHSIPYYRLMFYGWQPQVGHFDFAGILNANAIYSFTVGLPQLLFGFAFMLFPREARDPAPCETDPTSMCGLTEDFGKPIVQIWVVVAAVVIDIISIAISVANICIDFPAQVFEMMEKEEEITFHQMQAEAATREWDKKINDQLTQNVKKALKMSTQFKANTTPGMESPQLVIEEVIKMEKAAMKKRVGLFEYFLTKQEQALQAARKERLRRKREEQEEREARARETAERV